MRTISTREALTATLLAGAAFAATPASATVLFFEGESPTINNKVHAYSDGSHPVQGTTVYGITDAENELVKFTGDTLIEVTGGNGYAQIFDAADPEDLTSITIAMDDPTLGFSALEFALQFLNEDVSNQSPGALTITVFFMNGDASESKIWDGISNPGDKSYYLYDDAGRAFSSVVLSSAPDRLSQLKQTDINLTVVPPAVPEPTTWALLVAGFGVVGMAMRRKRATVAFA